MVQIISSSRLPIAYHRRSTQGVGAGLVSIDSPEGFAVGFLVGVGVLQQYSSSYRKESPKLCLRYDRADNKGIGCEATTQRYLLCSCGKLVMG